MNINFSESEMVEFLKKRGFIIEEVKCWTSTNTYHNNVETTYRNIKIAHKDDFNLVPIDDSYRLDSALNFWVERVFYKSMKESLLNMTF